MRKYWNYDVWQKAHQLTLDVYEVTTSFPADERFGLTAQLRRAMVSVESNIAEGSGRTSEKDFSRFLDMAIGSANEVECQARIARDLGYVTGEAYRRVTHSLSTMRRDLVAFRNHMQRSSG